MRCACVRTLVYVWVCVRVWVCVCVVVCVGESVRVRAFDCELVRLF